MSLVKLLKQPSGFLPPTMSLIALAIVVLHVARFGVTREADEGTAAHLWQLLMVGQLPIIGFFAMRWVSHATKAAMAVLALDVVAFAAAAAPVFVLKL
jgi:hypothetical protein